MNDGVTVKVTTLMAYYVREGLAAPFNFDLLAVYRDLKLKMFGVLLSREAVQEVVLTLEELWLLEGFARDVGMVGKDAVGREWLAAIGPGLLHLEASSQVHAATAQVGNGVIDEAPKGDMAARLAFWPGREEGR